MDNSPVQPAYKGPVMVAPRLPVKPKVSPQPEPVYEKPVVKAAPKRRFVSPIPVTEKRSPAASGATEKKTLSYTERAALKKKWNEKFCTIFQERWDGLAYSPWFLALTVILSLLSVYNLIEYLSPSWQIVMEAEDVPVLCLGLINISQLIGGVVTSAGLCAILFKKSQVAKQTNGFSALSAGLAFLMLSGLGTAALVILAFIEMWDAVDFSVDALFEIDVLTELIPIIIYAVFIPITIGKLRKISKKIEHALSMGLPDADAFTPGIWMPLVVVGFMLYYFMQYEIDYLDYFSQHEIQAYAEMAICLLSAVLVFRCRSEMLQLEDIKFSMNRELEEKYK